MEKLSIRSMAQENLRSLGESTSGYGYSYENDSKTFGEITWSDSEDGDLPKKDATCHIEIESQEVHLKPFSSNKTLNANDLQNNNLKLI